MIWPWIDGMSIKEYYHKTGHGKDMTMFDDVAHMKKILMGTVENYVPGFYVPCDSGGNYTHFRLSFIRNYYLGLNRKDVSFEREMIKPFIPFLERHRGSVVLLNRGAHFKPNDETLKKLTELFTYLRQKHADALVIFRDTPAGHLDHSKYQQSIPFTPKDAQVVRSKQTTNPLYKQYKYGSFNLQNDLVRQLIQKTFPEIIFMDVSNSTNLRFDSHTDPVHYCIPGPIDHWVQKLTDVLLVANAYPGLLPEGMRSK